MLLLVRRILVLGLLSLMSPAAAAAQPRAPLVLAASSLQEALGECADRWAAAGHPRPVLSFSASSALARQIDAGAPADLFLSADEPWMDHVEARGRLAPGTRVSFLANRLVLIAPAGSGARLSVGRGFPLARALGKGGRLAMADPGAVPAGKYGRAALEALGVWPSVAGRIAPSENVRAALALVERAAAPLGIVYATDAMASKKVRIVGKFPANSHSPITYPVARLKSSSNPEADAFRRFVISRAGKAIFARHGFVAL